jgi:hypothetical protein
VPPFVGDPDRLSVKMVDPARALSVVGVEDPELCINVPETEAVDANRDEMEGLDLCGSEAREPLGDWVRCLGRTKEPSRSVYMDLRKEAGGGLLGGGIALWQVMPRTA